MIEKFSDYEGTQYLAQEGQFVFEITNCEMKVSKSGSDMAVFNVKSNVGMSTLYHSLDPKARWSYNKLIKACKHLTPEQIKSYELDYATVGQELVGCKFIGTVEAQKYMKETKVLQEDGTFASSMEEAVNFKIVDVDDTNRHPEFYID